MWVTQAVFYQAWYMDHSTRHLTHTFTMSCEKGKGFLLLLVSVSMCLLLVEGESVLMPVGAILDWSQPVVQRAFTHGMGRYTPDVPIDIRSLGSMDGGDLILTVCTDFPNTTFGIFTGQRTSILDTIRSTSSSLRLPFVTLAPPVGMPQNRDDYVIQMTPAYMSALLDVIQGKRWSKLHYIHVGNDGLARLDYMYKERSNRQMDLEILSYSVRDGQDAIQTIENLSKKISRFREAKEPVFLDMPRREWDVLLRGIQTGMSDLHFILADLNIATLDGQAIQHDGIKVMGFKLPNLELEDPELKNEKNNWISESESSLADATSAEAMLAIDSATLLRGAYLDILQTNKDMLHQTPAPSCFDDQIRPVDHGQAVFNTLLQKDINGLSGRVSFDSHGFRQHYKLEFMEWSKPIGMIKTYTWQHDSGMEGNLSHHSQDLPRTHRRFNRLPNRTLIITSIITAPYLMLRDDVSLQGNDRFEGYCADLMKRVAGRLAFNYVIQPVKDSKYGSVDESGKWNGMIGELVRAEADLAVAPITITSSRERVVDFSKPYMTVGIVALLKKHSFGQLTDRAFDFMIPFSSEIWMAIAAAFLVTSLTFFFVSRLSLAEWDITQGSSGAKVKNRFTFLNSLWYILGGLMWQGFHRGPRSISGRVVSAFWWCFTVVMICSYTGTLMRWRISVEQQTPIQRVDDLIDQNRIQYGTVQSGATREFFRRSPDYTYGRMYAKMESAWPNVWVSSNEKGVRRVRESGYYAFLTESTTALYVSQRKPCDTWYTSTINSGAYGLATPLGSPLRELINLAVLALQETGELRMLEHKWFYDRGECGRYKYKPPAGEEKAVMGIRYFLGPFEILIGGVVLSLIVVVIEYIWKTKIRARQLKKKKQETPREDVRDNRHDDATDEIQPFPEASGPGK